MFLHSRAIALVRAFLLLQDGPVPTNILEALLVIVLAQEMPDLYQIYKDVLGQKAPILECFWDKTFTSRLYEAILPELPVFCVPSDT